MFDVPVDAMYVWVGVAAVSVAALGVVTALPTTMAPDASGVADAIDRVAVAPPGAQTTQDLEATQFRLGPAQVSLRNGAGSASASVVYGPMTPTVENDLLDLILHGRHPETVFESNGAFAEAVEEAQTRTEWRSAPAQLTIRRVSWGGSDVTLVG